MSLINHGRGEDLTQDILNGRTTNSGIRGDNEAVEFIVVSVIGSIEPTSGVREDTEGVDVIVISVLGVESTCGGPGDVVEAKTQGSLSRGNAGSNPSVPAP